MGRRGWGVSMSCGCFLVNRCAKEGWEGSCATGSRTITTTTTGSTSIVEIGDADQEHLLPTCVERESRFKRNGGGNGSSKKKCKFG